MRKIGFILCVLIIGACTKSEFCIEPNPATMRIAFKTYDSTSSKVDTPLVNADVYSTDTTVSLVEGAKKLISINAYPNRKLLEQTYIIFHSNVRDTLVVEYTPEENFISNGCGYQTFFKLEKVTFNNTRIDSVNITDVSVTDVVNNNHIEVIYK